MKVTDGDMTLFGNRQPEVCAVLAMSVRGQCPPSPSPPANYPTLTTG